MQKPRSVKPDWFTSFKADFGFLLQEGKDMDSIYLSRIKQIAQLEDNPTNGNDYDKGLRPLLQLQYLISTFLYSLPNLALDTVLYLWLYLILI